MTRYATRSCTCPPIVTGTGGKKPEPCEEHGERYLSPSQLNPPERTPRSGRRQNRKPMKRSEPKRDWSLAVAKKGEEFEVCRVCGATGTEAAHILGKKYDQPIAPGSKTLLVLPDRIVPLCGEWANRCHQRYDAHELDLLPHLTTEEQAQAVLDAGSMGSALKRISPMLELAA